MIKLNPDSQIIKEDVSGILSVDLPWHKLKRKTVAITGATGMLAAYVVETLLAIDDVKVITLVRNVEKARVRFSRYIGCSRLVLKYYDCKAPLMFDCPVNYIIHAASLPRPDVKIPVDVLTPNLIGTYYLLEAARQQKDFKQFVYFSSGAVYGEMKGTGLVYENQSFPVVANLVENCYSVGKMSGEALCAAYTRQYGLTTKMLRYAHTFGPGMDMVHDIRAFAEFMRDGLEGKDIVLQSAGTQKRCYCYISDATVALFVALFNGKTGEAYNIVNETETHSILEFANAVATSTRGRIQVKFGGVQNDSGYAPQKQAALMSGAKLRASGWSPGTNLSQAIARTMEAYSHD